MNFDLLFKKLFKRFWVILQFNFFFLFCFFQNPLIAQFPWPVTPFDRSQEITGTFAEYRDTGSADHFHNGTDIPKADGSPVYPVKDGVVTALSRTGSNAYVRVQDMAYVHILPRASLSVGDSVFASQSILGTILSGQGHVHFTNGFIGSERNSMLPGKGLTPLNDQWAPIIRYMRFYPNRSLTQFSSGKVSGLVDILVKVDEQNGPPTTRLSRRNNGTYKIGYKILSADKSTVFYSPPNDGLRFQFDTKPSNSYVHNVFSDNLSSTTSHVYIVTNNLSSDFYWDSRLLSPGNYTVMVFTEDTFANSDTLYSTIEVLEQDNTSPDQPRIKFVRSDEQNLRIGWYPNNDPDLLGYRLFFSFDNIKWQQRLDESKLTKTKIDTSFAVSLKRDIFFKIQAVDNAPVQNVSIDSDVYGSNNIRPEFKILIVDGFDRTETTGSWQVHWHDFATFYGMAISENNFGYETVANEAVIDSSIALEDYDAVMWFLGDESNTDETFSSDEQSKIESYLQQGGCLFVSGSEIAWDLDRDSSAPETTIEDENFLNNYLKVNFAGNDAELLAVTGEQGSIFEGLSFDFGIQPYEEDSPDFIMPVGNNTIVNLKYDDDKIAGIQFEGTFGEGSETAKLVYFGFPFETITNESERIEVMARILDFFFPTTPVAQAEMSPTSFALFQNYPNPFNPSTTISYNVPFSSHVTISVLNSLGQKIRTLVDVRKPIGFFKETWDGLNDHDLPVTSGLYLINMVATEVGKGPSQVFEKTMKMTLVR